MRIKKSLIEAKFIANSEDALKMADKMGKEDIVKIVDEAGVVNVPKKSLNNPKIEKFVNDLNALIKSAIDSDGDPIGVVDTSSTWEEPYVYFPIEYVNGKLKITSKSQYKNEPEVDIITRQNMEMDGVGTLRNIKKMYNLAVKRNGRQTPVQEDDHDVASRAIGYGQPEPELGDADWEELYKVMNQDVKNSDNEQV